MPFMFASGSVLVGYDTQGRRRVRLSPPPVPKFRMVVLRLYAPGGSEQWLAQDRGSAWSEGAS